MMNDVKFRRQIVSFAKKQYHRLQKIRHFEDKKPPTCYCALKTLAVLKLSQGQVRIITFIGMPSGDRFTGSHLRTKYFFVNQLVTIPTLPPAVRCHPSQICGIVEKYYVCAKMINVVYFQPIFDHKWFSVLHVLGNQEL